MDGDCVGDEGVDGGVGSSDEELNDLHCCETALKSLWDGHGECCKSVVGILKGQMLVMSRIFWGDL